MEDTLRDPLIRCRYYDVREVLILVLMEDTLRGQGCCPFRKGGGVLILVLMEDTLRGLDHAWNHASGVVLILVLMEDTLREQRLVSLCLSSFDVCLPL